MKSLNCYLTETFPVEPRSEADQLNLKVNEARACLPKRRVIAKDLLAQRVLDLKYLSKLNKAQRGLL
jgi:hypothetical protein